MGAHAFHSNDAERSTDAQGSSLAACWKSLERAVYVHQAILADHQTVALTTTTNACALNLSVAVMCGTCVVAVCQPGKHQ